VIGATPDPSFCEEYHAGLPSFWKRVYYWRTPTTNCGDSRGNICKNYNDWVSAWTQIKG
jgi:putative spermidine/putrescine transport system substrate-binding protein